ncbi:MAG TPA: histidine kinase [Candidatus Limnocylindrales bacterium]|nr:histidine kinase [Candidatus Limnocylindrales bacterium]
MPEPPAAGGPERTRRPGSDRVRPVDVLVALGLALLSLVAFAGGAAGVGPAGIATALLLLLESLPLIVRRRYPLEVMLVVVTATIVHIAIQPADQEIQAGLGVLVAIYTIGERLDRRTSLGLTLLTGAIVAVLFLSRAGILIVLQSLIQTELILGVAWLVGDAARIRRLYEASLEEQTRLAASEREARTRRAVLEERERIARELHDIVTHHVSVVVIQAGGGLRALAKRPEDTRAALEAIAATGRQALTDMRRMLGILGEREGQEPMPGLDGLADLVEQVRSAGLAIELSVEGRQQALDPGLELSAYRIIQEGLTNSLKHGAARANVTVRYGADTLDIAIDDVGGAERRPALEQAHDGRGLVGMRERVALFGGTFAAESTATGFRVMAHLPTVGTGPGS